MNKGKQNNYNSKLILNITKENKTNITKAFKIFELEWDDK